MRDAMRQRSGGQGGPGGQGGSRGGPGAGEAGGGGRAGGAGGGFGGGQGEGSADAGRCGPGFGRRGPGRWWTAATGNGVGAHDSGTLHEPTLTPALSRRTGEGAPANAGAGEGKSGRFIGDEQVRKERGALHEPWCGRARLPPSRRPFHHDPARQEPRPTGFMVTAHGREAKGSSHEPRPVGRRWKPRRQLGRDLPMNGAVACSSRDDPDRGSGEDLRARRREHRVRALRGVDLEIDARLLRGHHGPVGLGQVHHAEPAGLPGPPHRRQLLPRRRGRVPDGRRRALRSRAGSASASSSSPTT